MKKIFFIFFIFIQSSFAKEFRYLSRSPRGLLMGDAYTTLADDEYTLYYNPATLGRNLGVQINLFNPYIAANNIISDKSTFDDFPDNDATAISQRILGFPMHFSTGTAPYIKVGRLGFSFLANLSAGLQLNNAIHPVFNIDYRYDRGFVVGYAYAWGKKNISRKKRKKKRKSGGRSNSIGIGAKYITREGINKKFHLFGTEVLGIIDNSSGSLNDLKHKLGYGTGSSWGLDIGYERNIYTQNTRYTMGVSLTDIGETHFANKVNSNRIPRQEMFLNTGISMNQNFGLFDYTLALDLHPLNIQAPFLRKVHLGMEFSLPFFSFLLGWNGGYKSFGIEVDLWALRLTAGYYDVEVGETFRQQKSSRMLLYLNLLDISFDDLGLNYL